MKTRTKIMSLLLAMLMTVAVLPISVSAASTAVAVYGSNGAYKSGYASFEEAWKAAVTGDTIKLLANCVVDPTSHHVRGFQSNSRDLTVDLNGFVMSQASGTTTRFFHIKQPSTLTIKDSNPTAVHKYTKDATTGLYTWDDAAGTIEIPGGAITGGYAGDSSSSHTKRGGAVYLQGGCLKVEGGNFIGNRAIQEGGAVATTAIWYDSDQTDWAPSIKISGGLFIGNVTDNDDQDTFGGTYVTASTFPKPSYKSWTESYINGGVFSDALLGGFNGDNTVEGKGVSAILSEGYELIERAGRYGCSKLYAATLSDGIVFRGVQRTADNGGKYSLRVIAEVERSVAESASVAAFGIKLGANTEKEFNITKYYTTLTAVGDNGEMAVITPKDGYVLLAVIINNVPSSSAEGLTVGAYVESESSSFATDKRLSITLVPNADPKVGWEGDTTTDIIGLEEPFARGNLELNFKLKRNSTNTFTLTPSGLSSSDVGVFISANKLTVGDESLHVTTEKMTATSIPAGEWFSVSIVYTLEQERMGVMAVIKNASGKVLASVALSDLPTVSSNKTVTQVELQASGWEFKDFTSALNPLKTGDVVSSSANVEVLETNSGFDVNLLTVNGFHTIRPYFGNYSILPDNSGMICGTSDGSFYRYDFADGRLTYLDRTALWIESVGAEYSNAIFLQIAVNPETGNVFYLQYNQAGNRVLYKINPKTLEKTELYEVTRADMVLQTMPTYDERYVSYEIGGYAGETAELGVIDLQTKTVYGSAVVSGADGHSGINHVIINPTNPNLILFHSEYNDTHVLDLENDTVKTYSNQWDKSTHAIWSYGGEYVTATEFSGGTKYFTVMTKELEHVSTTSSFNCAHAMCDESRTWVVGDSSGIVLKNMSMGGETVIVSTSDTGTAVNNSLNHPYHGHPEITADGGLISWGHRTESGVLGVAWLSNPNI